MVNFHGHSTASFYDAIVPVKEYSDLAKMLNAKSIGISEHANICSWIQFDSEMKKAGINPRLSVEFYFYFDSDPLAKKSYHLMVTAMNDIGFRNILKLLYLSNLKLDDGGGYYYRSRISMSMLYENRHGLQIGGSCLSGPVSSHLIKGDIVNARLIAQEFKENFGENYHLEIFPHRMELQAKINREIVEIGKELDIPVIISLDSHYATPEFTEAYLINGRNRRRITKSEVENNDECLKDADFFFKSPETCLEILECEHCIDRNVILGAMDFSVQLDNLITFDYKDKFEIPKFDPEDDDRYLEKLLAKKLTKHFNGVNNIPNHYKERLRYEFNIIKEKKFSAYFNILDDVMQFCSANDIRLGGRGSVGGSLIAFLLGLYPLDPIAYGLSFERFINPFRAVPPDVDLDCPSSKREMIIEYLKSKWGEKRVVQVITFGEVKAKSAIKEAATYFEIPYQEINALTSHIPSFEREDGAMHDLPLSKALEIPEVARYQQKFPKLFDIALKLEGTCKTHGVHAGGVCILPDDADKIAPIMQKKGDQGADVPVVAWEKKDLEKIGILKFDYLGLNLLEVLAECERLTGVKLDDIPLDNKEAWAYIQAGKNMKSIFQLSEPKTCKYLRDSKPENILDLASVNSGIRPGTDWNTFLEGKKSGKYCGKYDLPEFRQVLGSTYGSILFQESLLFLFSELSDLNLGESDLLRRALEKGDPKGIDKYKDKFISTCKYKDLAVEIFEYLSTFTSYSFNLSHSAIYSLNGYWCAYFKSLFPHEFLIANIKFAKSSNKMTETEYIADLISEARAMGLKINLPKADKCQIEPFYDKSDNCIYLGLASLKGMTSRPASVIIDACINSNINDIKQFGDYCMSKKVVGDKLSKTGKQVERSIITKAHLKTLLYIGFFGENLPEKIAEYNKAFKEELEVKEYEQAVNEILAFDYFNPIDKIKKQIDPRFLNEDQYLIGKLVETKSGEKNGRRWNLMKFEVDGRGQLTAFYDAKNIGKGSFVILKYDKDKSTDDKIKVLDHRVI